MERFVRIIAVLFLITVFGHATDTHVEIGRTDIYEAQGLPAIKGVVIGYNAAVTDYIVAARIAVRLTSKAFMRTTVQLSCTDGAPREVALILPKEREVPLYADIDKPSGLVVVVGGPRVNQYSPDHLLERLKDPGDAVVIREGDRIHIAGYTAEDTVNAVESFLRFVDQV
ncbi:MAG: hypothetical protein QF415_04525 [Candidatus Undinarchaeales archaeon]|jgi:hypothetical protein|nr:hypothetical protein [Candidatus Undinarchaeales archaeon]MDP7492513.1 hypothetical protein [Candidatus Undinarchaeales archaeon]